MILRAHAGAVAASLTALLALAACDEDQAFYIMQNQAPSTGCFISTDETIYRSQGLLDVSLGEGYQLFPLVRNDLPARKPSGDTSDRAEPHLLQLREFRVKLDLGDVPQSVPAEQLEFTRPTSGVLAPGGKRASTVEVIPATLVQQLKLTSAARPTVIASLVAVAQTGGGDTMESMRFYYPIILCHGCLVRTLDSCTGVEKLTSSNACGLPQDAPLLCCKDPSGLLCLAGN